MTGATLTPREAATRYMAAGWKLCAIAKGSKGPNYPAWERHPLQIEHVNGQGLGLLHALSGTCAIDVDDMQESARWLDARGIDLDCLLGADDAVQVHSGRANRAKLLYRLPRGVSALPTRKLKTHTGATMIEFRCASNEGASVQDVLPPTIHPDTGKPYQWGGAGDFSQLPELPGALLALWKSLDGQSKGGAPAIPPTTGGGAIPEGGRNDALYKMAGDMARMKFPVSAITAALQEVNVRQCNPPLPRSEVSAIAVSASVTSNGAREAGMRASSEPWAEPTPLPDALPPVMAFDADLLPVALRGWVMDIAHRMQCPADFPAVAALVALSSLIGARAAIQPKARDDWQVVPNLWGAIVGRPGVKKSPALNEALKPLHRLQATEFEQWQLAHEAWQLDCKVEELAAADREKKAKGLANKDKAAARALLTPAGVPAEPTARRYIVNDATVEKLGELLQQNQWGTLCYRDELYGLLTSLDKQGQEGSRAFYLTGYDGNQGHTFDRIIRGTVHVPRVCLAMIGGIQPGRIHEYVRGAVSGGGADDGLLQRFGLTVWPDVAGEFVHVDQWPDSPAKQTAWAVFERLAKLESASDTEPVVWRFSSEAQAVFVEWLVPLETELRGDTMHPALVSHLAKYRKLIPALALVFALIDTPESGGVVHERELIRALAWDEYLRTHANRLYAAAVIPETTDAVTLLSKIRASKLTDGDGALWKSFTPRQIAVKGWAGLGTSDAVRKAADLLADYDWLRRDAMQTGAAGGRPSDRYTINPAALKGGVA